MFPICSPGMRMARATVVDCRPADRADEEFYRVAGITAGVCERIGWEYLLAGEPEPVRAANLRWLAGYRRPYARVGGDRRAAAGGGGAPVPLIELAGSVGDPVAVLPTLFHLLWAGALERDLRRPLRGRHAW